MAASPLTDVVMAACALKATAPEAFKIFCDTLRAFETQAIVESIAADKTREIFRAQGKVKTIQQLRKHVTDCYELRDTYTRRDPNARTSA